MRSGRAGCVNGPALLHMQWNVQPAAFATCRYTTLFCLLVLGHLVDLMEQLRASVTSVIDLVEVEVGEVALPNLVKHVPVQTTVELILQQGAVLEQPNLYGGV